MPACEFAPITEADGILTVTFSREDKLNAITPEMTALRREPCAPIPIPQSAIPSNAIQPAPRKTSGAKSEERKKTPRTTARGSWARTPRS